MGTQKIVWTVLPFGRMDTGLLAGRLRVSIVASPRLTPDDADEQRLGAAAFRDFHNWPKTLAGARFTARVDGHAVPLETIGRAEPELWDVLFPPDTPVAGFVFKDMSRVNLRSYAVRNVVGFVRRHYGNLAVQAAGTHPTLLPWKQAHGGLKGMLGDLGTRTQTVVLGDRSVELPAPGFDRFFEDKDSRASVERTLQRQVFGPDSRYRAPVAGVDGQATHAEFPIRVLPPDWQDPAAGGPDSALMGQFQTADEYTFYQASRFYRRSTPTPEQLAQRRPDLENVPDPVEPPAFDFHRILASFADYPEVLRALGLVVDCVLPERNPVAEALDAASVAEGTLGLEIEWDGDHDPKADAYPRTAWRASKARFATRARTGDHADGLLRLAGTRDPTLASRQEAPPERGRGAFDVFQLDPDGASLKTAHYLLTAQNLVARSLRPGSHGDVTYTTGDRQPVAALRSGGLGVSRHGRAAEVAMTAASAALKNAAVEDSADASRKIVLFTEDVLRGYRVDVQHRDRWFSLCRREGDYRLLAPQTTLAIGPDEGYVKGASTSGDGTDDHYLHESLFRWTGWSLVAERPGRTIRAVQADDSALQGEAVQEVDDAADKGGNGLAVRFRAERGSLPRLRFGQDYRFRARIVDLAGNSLGFDDPGLEPIEQATEPVAYLRFEPVDPPALVHRHRVSEGESLERMVIRSNFDASPADYLQTTDFTAATQAPESADFEYREVGERHVVPPKSSQLQCEQHALFDDAFGGAAPATVKAAYEIAAREAGTLFDALPGTQIELVTPTAAKDVARTTTVPPALPNPAQPTGERMVGGQYILHRESSVQTPYLPDAAAAGFALREQARGDFERIGIAAPMVLGPDAAVVQAPNQELVLVVRHGRKWPFTQGLRIVLAERAHTLDDGPCQEKFPDDGRPRWDETQRVLTLFVRKGHVVRLRYASFVDARFIEQFGLPRWSNSSGERRFIEEMAVLGAHWMLTPYRTLVLVHATQQPVCTPRLQKVSTARVPGGTHADLDAAVQLHGPSTGKIEVVAEWSEWIDDPQRPAPVRVACSARLAQIGLPENGPNGLGLAGAAAADMPPAGNALGGGSGQRLPGNRHEFGDTRFRLVRYRLEAATRFREYLPPSLYAERARVTRLGPEALESMALVGGIDDPGAAVLFDVPGAAPDGTRVRSTAAPDVPRIVYAVPTFRWSQDLGAGRAVQTSTRHGNGLRVYLERPWFSSGDGELLGVVLLADGGRFTDIPEAMLPYVTQWGLDPLFDSSLPKSIARAGDFTARVGSENVALIETGATVHVVGHRVQWDGGRRLWYADVELDAGATYMPFVRLALVRLQPHSLPGAKVSRVALAEFAQVLPRRRAVVESSGQSVTVSVRGPVPDHGPMDYHNDSAHLDISFIPPPGSVLESGRNKIELVLQTRDPDLDSDLAWSDMATLASGLALPLGAKVEKVPGGVGPILTTGIGTGIFGQPAVPAAATVVRPGTLGQPQSFTGAVRIETDPPPGVGGTLGAGTIVGAVSSVGGIGATTGIGGVGGVVVGPIFEIDPPIWETTVNLPSTGGKPARLVLREFERYYTDRTVPDKRSDRIHRKRVVEERLVYSEFFALNGPST